ncbi:antitoxin [Aliivibrio fischeri]|uniref:type II toxin-antitoxin system Phd/YefM family antitoxin n=1 Tax=Aliivibrio fischeri TaxID=668 RepID=UPI0012D93C8A|nr:type II toxin-antitoxin system Phd/YefM family antitoxin [Aliivibrio fischeri]MUK91901.1 antitoxin [Aliivibrio fischeri]
MQTNTIRPILADCSTSISELKANPMAVIDHGDGFPVAVLNRNKPVFYCVPAEQFEVMLDKLEDIELAQLVQSRKDQPEIEVDINDL